MAELYLIGLRAEKTGRKTLYLPVLDIYPTNPLLPGINDYLTMGLLAYTLGVYQVIILQFQVGKPPLVRRHRLKSLFPAGIGYLFGNPAGKLADLLLPPGAETFHIDDERYSVFQLFSQN
jgi:hypothetical protein